MENTITAPQPENTTKMCSCGSCWSHKRPGRILLGIALLIIVFSAGLAIGSHHSRFGHYGHDFGHHGNMMYGRTGMMGGFGHGYRAVPTSNQSYNAQDVQYQAGPGMMRLQYPSTVALPATPLPYRQ